MTRDVDAPGSLSPALDPIPRDSAPGKRTLTSRLPGGGDAAVQLRRAPGGPPAAGGDDPFALHLAGTVQMSGAGGQLGDDQVVDTAERGVAGAGQALPHADTIQRSFGHHDVGGIDAHVGGAAAEAASSMGALAYATGNSVGFQSSPDLHTAAHEAAHVVQQRGGVSFKGVGQAGDRYEQHADAVADAVVAGRSAEGLLDGMAGSGGGGSTGTVQRITDEDLTHRAESHEGGGTPTPAPTTGTPVAELGIHADTETADRTVLTRRELQNAQVGHSWITLKYKDPSKVPDSVGSPTKNLLKGGGTAMGFWPLIRRARQWNADGSATDPDMAARLARGETPGAGASSNPAHTGFSLNPFKSVPGRVEEPDDAHSAKGSKTYELTQPQVDSLMTYVNASRNKNYNLYSYNCTTFAVQAVNASGHTAPSGAKFGLVALPNQLYKDILQMKVDGDSTATTTPLGSDETETTPSRSKR